MKKTFGDLFREIVKEEGGEFSEEQARIADALDPVIINSLVPEDQEAEIKALLIERKKQIDAMTDEQKARLVGKIIGNN